jgi:multiple sugar transport system permease protein
VSALTAAPVTTPPGPRTAAAARSRRPRRASGRLSAHGYLAGAVLCFALFAWYPMVREFVMSFQRTRRGVTTWVGWQNYERLWHDPSFAAAWRNTALFTVLALAFGYALPFLIAVLLNEFRHAQGYLRALVYLPVMLPPASALLLFRYAYDPGGGIFNRLLQLAHLPTSQWTQSTTMALPSLVIASTWMNMGNAILIYLAALQSIPGELYEAAELDGARLLDLREHATVPEQPDRAWVDAWLHRSYLNHWHTNQPPPAPPATTRS